MRSRSIDVFRHASLLLPFLLALSLAPTHAFEWGSLDVHGFISQGYLKSSHNNYLARTEDGTTEFNEAALTVSTELTDKLRVGMQILARDLGDAGDNKVDLDWGYGDYRWRDALGVRIGKVKRPMGLFNEGRDMDMLRTSILLPQSVYREDMRDISNAAKGGAIYGTIPIGRLGSFDYQHVYGSKDIDLESKALRKQLIDRFPGVDPGDIRIDIRYTDTTYVLWRTPLNGLRLAGSYEIGEIDVDSSPVAAVATNTDGVVIPAQPARELVIKLKRVWAASAEYRWQDLTLAAEYLDTLQSFSLDSGPHGSTRQETHSQGYYGLIAYRFAPRLEAGAYYGIYYPYRGDKHGHDLAAAGIPDFLAWQKDACLTFRFDPVPGWIIKLEGHRINGAAQVFDYDDPRELEKVWNLFAAKITYNF